MSHLRTGAMMISLNRFLIASILSFLISKYSVIAINEMAVGVCITANNNTNNRFQDNLQSLVGMFRSEAASRSYAFYATGNSPDKAYGHFLCRGDTTSDLCSTCVTRLIISTTATCVEGFTFTDTCMVYYANYSFQGKSTNDTVPGIMFDNSGATREYNQTVEGVVEGLITDVDNIISTNDTRRYWTREARVGRTDEKVYGLAQCTPDINKEDCTKCLKAARSHMQGCCGDTNNKLTFVVLPSCQLKYDNTRFYVVSSSVVATASATTFPLVAVSGLIIINWLFC